MNRTLLASGLVLLVVGGCQLPAERMPLKQLPEDTQPLPYAELLTRARMQSSAATEAFYVSRWDDLEDAARGLEQTARFLPRCIEVPANRKSTLAAQAKALEAEAARLLEAVRTQEVKQTNEILQHINLQVRELRLVE